MATTSFDRAFTVRDKASIKAFKEASKTPRKVTVTGRDYKKDRDNGVKLLKQRLSGLETC